MRHACLLEGFGACSPEKIFKNGAILCILEDRLLKFCQKKFAKMFSFYIKIIDNLLLLRTIFKGIRQNIPHIFVNCAIWCAMDAGVHFLRTFSYENIYTFEYYRYGIAVH